jgi:hypothetical protein
LDYRFGIQSSIKPFNSSKMKDINFKDCRKAVNQAKFRPTAQRKAEALKLLKQLTKAIASLEVVTAPKPKASKRKPKNTKLEVQAQALSRGTAQTYIEPKVEPSYQAPRKEVYTLSEGETPEVAMAKIRTKRLADAKAVAIAEFEATL